MTDGDLISRKEVLNMFNTMDRYKADKLILQDTDKKFPGNEVFIVDDCYELLEQLSTYSAEQTRWIPVSERLPEKSGNYWCTFGGTHLTGKDSYTTEEDAKEIFEKPEEYIGWRSQNVIAWMPLLKPYKEESGEAE